MTRIAIKSVLIYLALSSFALAQEPVSEVYIPEEDQHVAYQEPFTFGGDVRLRHEHFQGIPFRGSPRGATRGNDNHFSQLRTRFWGHLQLTEDVAVRGRLANEFRHYYSGDEDGWDALDEIVVDQLYVDLNNIFNGLLDLRLGRQELFYGTGKIIDDGTPKDKTRTSYFDAVRLRFNIIDNSSIDFFGIYNDTENRLVLNNQDRDLVGYDFGYNDGRESGAGIYFTNLNNPDLGFETYYVFKHESSWVDSMDEGMPKADINTFGFRLMPRFTPFSANLEAAYQFGERGDRDQNGLMVDASITKHFGDAFDTRMGIGLYYLSGNDPDSDKDEGWNPLWARTAQYSELVYYAFDADGIGRWSNMNFPHVDFSISPFEWLVSDLKVGYMFAPERDGPGGGGDRGLLATLNNNFEVGQGYLTARDRVTGNIVFEMFAPGNYYLRDGTATLGRLELTYEF